MNRRVEAESAFARLPSLRPRLVRIPLVHGNEDEDDKKERREREQEQLLSMLHSRCAPARVGCGGNDHYRSFHSVANERIARMTTAKMIELARSRDTGDRPFSSFVCAKLGSFQAKSQNATNGVHSSDGEAEAVKDQQGRRCGFFLTCGSGEGGRGGRTQVLVGMDDQYEGLGGAGIKMKEGDCRLRCFY